VRPPPDASALLAAGWTALAVVAVHVQLRQRRPVRDVRVPTAPSLPGDAVRGVHAVLRRRSDTCLVRAIVRQAWYVGQGEAFDVIIGVRRAGPFEAHAWLEGEQNPLREGYVELSRRVAVR
jgi:hypothetical protein